MKRSGIIALAASGALTVLAVVLGGHFGLLIDVQPYFLIGLLAVLLVAFLNTRRELASSAGRHRLCLQFISILASCIVCLGLLLTLIILARAVFCTRFRNPTVWGDLVVGLLPFLYCLAIAEVACPALSHYFGCRIKRAEQAKPDAKSNSV